MDAAEWDDSVLIHAFNSAMSKYQEMHGSSKKSKGVEHGKSTSFLPNQGVQGVDERPQVERCNGSESKEISQRKTAVAAQPDPVECAPGSSHAVGQEGFASPRHTTQGQEPATEQAYSYDSAAMDGYTNLPGPDQYYALQPIYYQLQQLELQQQELRQQLQAWTGLAGWNGMQHHANHGHTCQTQGSHPSSSLPFPLSPHVYPCYCHYPCPALSAWTCTARCSCFPPPCPVHGHQPRWCHSSFPHSSPPQGRQHFRAHHHQCCPADSNSQQVSKNCQDAEIGTAGK